MLSVYWLFTDPHHSTALNTHHFESIFSSLPSVMAISFSNNTDIRNEFIIVCHLQLLILRGSGYCCYCQYPYPPPTTQSPLYNCIIGLQSVYLFVHLSLDTVGPITIAVPITTLFLLVWSCNIHRYQSKFKKIPWYSLHHICPKTNLYFARPTCFSFFKIISIKFKLLYT